MAQLTFSRGSGPVFRVLLHSSSTKLGRGAHCDVVLDDPEISREHAAIYRIEGKFHLKKLGQATLQINGKEVESHTLKPGDELRLGPWLAKFSETHSAADAEEDTVVTDGSHSQTQAVAKGPGGLWVQDWCLMLSEPARPPRRLKFNSQALTVGAHEKNDIVVQDPYASSRHLKILLGDGRVQVFDLASTNGVFVNGVKVREAELEAGQSLKFGQCEIAISTEEKFEKTQPKEIDRFYGMVGASLEMRSLYALLEKVAPPEAGILILGESGTGKELVAGAIHKLSPRARGPLVAINCGAISPELIESELFGHEKGAFTGALRQHDGAFGQARGGTLFLDEVGELPLELQPKLLRVLENRSYRRVGGSEELQADVRVVAATHRDLAKAVKEKRFREDLFFRLFIMPIHLPPLRERKEDLPLLCAKFLGEFSSGALPKKLSPEAFALLREHDFPGNVRELRNVLLRAVILSPGEIIEVKDLAFPQKLAQAVPGGVSLETMEEMEKRLVLKALTVHSWNKARAAEALGVAKSTLFAKIKLYDLREPTES
ncbi:MAG TPA: sigma-54-dependent Fis family transcriptional regulator [Deltaproteobacteria bacterium]|nr:sigma-54-dependent Fis family transcriptional regulator [Deltaproteobacteria bacterium]